MASFAKVGKKGEIELPEDVREKARLKEGDSLSVETKEDGSIILRPTPPVREYTDEDIEMFAREDETTSEERERFLEWLDREPRFFGR
ncbi:MAG: AbrB/MazE/SpoVT family DNA-binding domain-containing protein [Actinomycetota bacterium]|jgi:AbrB family looped-hinge helix DNA binding protein|nr:AbrB/MazE/SpoVT family DNA-binding domain-containing protein [Actinomycetota bacterium]